MKLVALVLGVLFLSYPLHQGNYYVDLVSYSGCKAAVVENESAGPEQSFFAVDESGPFIVIGVNGDSDLPMFVGTMILLHEAGHCLQYQEGLLGDYRNDPKKYELDADRRAADLACGMGMDGRGMLKDLFVWAREVLGYTGDMWHGTSDERMAQGDRARRCDKPSIQSWQYATAQ